MSLSDNKFNIFVNIFVHYPEVYNSTVIERRLNIYFNNYFSSEKKINSELGNVNVMIKSAPHNENQFMNIDVVFTGGIDNTLNNQEMLLEWKEYLFIYFDRQIKEFYFNFTN